MDSAKIKMWKAKLKASKAEERQWAKAYNRAERAMLRVGRQIDELERKTENELAKIKQRVGATQ
jgi:tetrahydromethanopterin S-methyltransferase subunit G